MITDKDASAEISFFQMVFEEEKQKVHMFELYTGHWFNIHVYPQNSADQLNRKVHFNQKEKE